MKARTLAAALVLVGAWPVAEAAPIPSVPTRATAAAEACRAAWPPERLDSIEFAGQKIEILRAEFTRPMPSVLCMRGVFSRDTQAKIHAIADPAAIKSLVISSDGGFTEPAIELAKLAERHRWLIVVQDKCFSSCANYVFLSRTSKVVLPQSVIGWHGLPPDPSEFDPAEFEKQKPQMGPEWADVDAKTALSFWVHSKEFLAERAIPPELCRSRPQAGHAKDYVARLNALGTSGANPFWSYGRAALEKRFKVRGIRYMWEPRTPEEGTELAKRQFKAELFFFDLSRGR